MEKAEQHGTAISRFHELSQYLELFKVDGKFPHIFSIHFIPSRWKLKYSWLKLEVFLAHPV